MPFDASIGEATIDVTVRLDRLQRDLRDLSRNSQRTTRRIEKGFDDVNRSVNRASSSARQLKTALAAITTGALGVIVQRSLQAAENLQDMANRANVSAQRLQELSFAATQSGASARDMTDALTRLTRRLGLFAEDGGGPGAAAFERLGISARDAAGNVRSSEDVFDEIVRKLQAVGSEAERAAILSSAFGEDAGPKLRQLIEQGTGALERFAEEARKSGVVLDQETISKAADANAAFRQLSQVVSATATIITAEFAPALEDLADKLASTLPRIQAWAQGASQAFRAAFQGLEGLSADELIEEINRLNNQRAIAIQNPITGIEDAANIDEQLEQLRNELLRRTDDTIEAYRKRIDGARGDVQKAWEGLAAPTNLGNSGGGQATREQINALFDLQVFVGEITAQEAQLVQFTEKLNELLNAGVIDTSSYDRLLNKIRDVVDEQANLQNLEGFRQIQEIIGEIDPLTSELERYQAVLENVRIDGRNLDPSQVKQKMDALEKELVRPEIEAAKRTLGNIAVRVNPDLASVLEATQAVEEAVAALDILELRGELVLTPEQREAFVNDVREAVLRAEDAVAQFGEQVKDTLENGLGDVLKTAITDADNLGAAFGRLRDRLLDIALDSAIQALLGGGGGGGAGGFGGILGGLIGGLFGGGRATGGPVSAGTAHVVGEQGPELFVPNFSGQIMNNRQLRQGISREDANAAPGTTVNVYHSVEAPGATQETVQRIELALGTMAKDFDGRVVRAVRDAQGRGSL